MIICTIIALLTCSVGIYYIFLKPRLYETGYSKYWYCKKCNILYFFLHGDEICPECGGYKFKVIAKTINKNIPGTFFPNEIIRWKLKEEIIWQENSKKNF